MKSFKDYVSESGAIDFDTMAKTVKVLNDHADIYYKFLESLRKELRKATPSDFFDNLGKISNNSVLFNIPTIYKNKLTFHHQLEVAIEKHIESMRLLEREFRKNYNPRYRS